jgi:predicted 2-oxoglutarate/Fe(II)-dependent dioxygenase YbiX
MSNLKDYIIVVPDVVPLELCNAVLAEYKNCDDWIAAITAAGKTNAERQCSTIGVSFSGVIEKNQETRQKIDQKLFACAAKAIQEYNKQFTHCTIQEDSGYELLKYEVGQFYKEHLDSFKDRPRAVSCSFVLNDDYEGGEFAFFNRELTYKIPKGSALMFPSNFMYPHEVMPVTSGTRYSIVTWFI